VPLALFHWLVELVRMRPDQLPSLPSCVEAIDEPNDAVRYHAMVHDGLMMITEAYNAARASRRRVEACIDRRALVDQRNELLQATAALQGTLQASATPDALRACARSLRELWLHRQEQPTTTRVVPPNPAVPTRLERVHLVRWTRSGLARAHRDLAAIPHDSVADIPRVAPAHLDLGRLDEAQLSLLERLARPQFEGDGEVPRWQLAQILGQWLYGTAHDRSLDEVVLATRRGREAAERWLQVTAATPHDEDVPAEAVDAWRELEQVAESLEAAAKTLELAMGRLGSGMAAVDTLATWALTEEVEPDGDYVREAQQAYELLFPGSTLRW